MADDSERRMTRGTTRIRRSRFDDGDAVIDIWRAAVDATHHFLTREDRIAIDVEVQRFLPRMPLWLAVDGRDLAVGFMGVVNGSIDALFVHPAHHGMGVGRSLVDHALELHPTLTTTVNEQNAKAIGFYERCGFVRIGRAAIDDQGRSYPVLHLRLVTQTHPHSVLRSSNQIELSS